MDPTSELPISNLSISSDLETSTSPPNSTSSSISWTQSQSPSQSQSQNTKPTPSLENTTKQAEVNPAREEHTDNDNATKTFTLFPLLPYELRLKIYALINHSPRTVRISYKAVFHKPVKDAGFKANAHLLVNNPGEGVYCPAFYPV